MTTTTNDIEASDPGPLRQAFEIRGSDVYTRSGPFRIAHEPMTCSFFIQWASSVSLRRRTSEVPGLQGSSR